MVEDDLNNRVPSFSDKTNFSIIHLNARSLLKNLDKLNQMLRNFKKTILCNRCVRNVAG